MSDQASGKAGPVMADSVQEVQGIFPSDAAMQDAVSKLTLAGFDRADLSLPTTQPHGGMATPEQGADAVVTDVDLRQARTMGTGMLGSIGAIAAAGATIATGGTAGVAIAAAAAAGIGTGLFANAAGSEVKTVQGDEHDEAARQGQLVLAVHAATTDKQREAEHIMRASGASEVATVERTTQAASIDSTSWTG